MRFNKMNSKKGWSLESKQKWINNALNQIIRKDNVKLNIYCIKIKNNHTDKWMSRMNHWNWKWKGHG